MCQAPDGDIHNPVLIDDVQHAVLQNVHNWCHELIAHFRRLGLDFPSAVIWQSLLISTNLMSFSQLRTNKNGRIYMCAPGHALIG